MSEEKELRPFAAQGVFVSLVAIVVALVIPLVGWKIYIGVQEDHIIE